MIMPNGKKSSWFAMKAANGSGSINIFGDIGGWGVDFQSFQAQLDSLGVGAGGQLNIAINSDGGDVFQGFAIYQALAMHPAQKNITVMGLAASMASVVTMAGDKRIMPKNSVLMIHNPVGAIAGQADEITSYGELVSDMRDKIAQAYVDASDGKLTLKAALGLMDKQSWIGADKALELGLATDVIDPVQMAAKIVSRYPNAPTFGKPLKGQTMTTKTGNEAAADPTFEGADAEALAKAGTDARTALLAQQKEVRSLCNVAGVPSDVAADFNEKGLTMAQAVAELDKMKKEGKLPGTVAARKPGKAADGELSARHAVGDGAGSEVAEINPTAIWAKYNKTKTAAARRH